MVQLFLKYTDDNYYALDLDENEEINYKLTVKDLSDITKIFAPFTQSFSLKATDKNKILCGFIGNEKIQQINNTRQFNCKIYISGFLFQAGVLKFQETNYILKEQKSFKTNFASNLTGLTELLGDSTIQDLFLDLTDPSLILDWSVFTLKDRMTSVISKTLLNGKNIKIGIPFISNNRVWSYDETNLNIIDNIAFNRSRTSISTNQIELTEVRPAISYMTIMEHLLIKIGSPIICPLFDSTILKDLFVWCSSENLVLPKVSSYPLLNYVNPLVVRTYDIKQDSGAVSLPLNSKWLITADYVNGIIKAKRNNATSGEQGGWSDGFDINLKFNNLVSLEGSTGTKIKVALRNTGNGVVLDSREVNTNQYTFRVIDTRAQSPTMLDQNGELFFKLEILPVSLAKWENIEVFTVQKFSYTRKVTGVRRTSRVTYEHKLINNTSSASLGGNKINVISTLPNMKCIDFLKSFFLTFNIQVLSTGKPDNSMHWVTPSDIQQLNKEYSRRVVDYTQFVDVATVNKKEANDYNQYSLTHFESKYYESQYGDDSYFGALTYPTVVTGKANKFAVKTGYSILKQASTFSHPSTAKTCLAFEKDTAEILENGAVRYTPVFGELTIFYLQPKETNFNPIAVQYTNSQNNQLYGILEASYKDSKSGKILSFAATDLDTDSLYVNYYKTLIEKLLRPNIYLTDFNLNLPANEIFLNFANVNQGESNIPVGFRAQNEIIIGEQRYELSDASISLTSGKAKLTLLNF
jgi:hypothetical protein